MKRTVTSTLLVAVLMCISGYAALFVAPDERTMHAAQRIFYFHVPSWIAMFTAFFIAVIGNITYLTKRSPKWDWLSVASVEVGVTCCTIGLVTGPLWAKPIWAFGGRGMRNSPQPLFCGCCTSLTFCSAQ